jgi:alkylmercury lyase-like protein
MQVELRYFEDCPNWKAVDDKLRRLQAELGFRLSRRVVATPEEAEQLGFRGSPTIMVDGADVFAAGDEPIGLGCRIFHTPKGIAGMPTDEQLRSAVSPRSAPDAKELVRATAFRLLFSGTEPITLAKLADTTGMDLHQLNQVVAELDARGRIRRDEQGRVIGSAGLSVVPDRHEIDVQGRRFWTWCAYDIFGIFGALQADGRAWSPSPPLGSIIEVDFKRGRPQPGQAALLRLDEELLSCYQNVYEEWCSKNNLFANRKLAEDWAAQHGLRGQVLSLDEAADRATPDWVAFAAGLTV